MAGKYMLKTSDTYFGQNSTKSNDLDKVIWQKIVLLCVKMIPLTLIERSFRYHVFYLKQIKTTIIYIINNI